MWQKNVEKPSLIHFFRPIIGAARKLQLGVLVPHSATSIHTIMQIFYTSVEGQRATFQVRGTKFTPRKGIELLRKKKKFHGVKWKVRIKKRKQQGQPYTLKKEKLHT